MFVLIALIVPISLFEKSAPPSGSSPTNCENACENTQSYVAFDGPGWKLGDSYPQWIMAVFTAAAAGISIWAVRLVNDTLEESRKATVAATQAAEAANRSNEIARAEQRPWLTLRRKVECIFTYQDVAPDTPRGQHFRYTTDLQWIFDIENVGRTPAFGIKTSQKVILADFPHAELALREFVDAIDTEWDTKGEYTVFPGEKDEYDWTFLGSGIPNGRPVDGEQFFLLFAISYRSQERDIYGLEARLLNIEFDRKTFGPWGPRLLEVSDARITR